MTTRKNVGVRLPQATLDRLHVEAEARSVTLNWLMERAIEDFLDHLVPPDEFRLTQR